MTPPKQIHSLTFGHGPRPALALHCTLAHAGAWRSVGAALADTLTITAIDMPSHGKSAVWSGIGDFHRCCTDAALPFLMEPMDVIGHSFGATVALRLAIEHPERVRSLTMIEPVLFAVAGEDAPEELTTHEEEARPYLEALEAGNMALAARLFNRLWGDGTRWDDFHPAARAYMTERMFIVPAQTAAIFDDNAHLLAPERMSRAAMPTLLIAGSKSPAIARTINAALVRRLPDAQTVTIPDAGHMAPMTHPSEVAEAIAALVEMA